MIDRDDKEIYLGGLYRDTETSKEDDANNIPTRSGNMYRIK